MANAGSALMGIGRASGDDRAAQAAQQAIESPLIEVSIDGAKGVLFNVTGGYDMSMSEIQEAAEIITSAVSPDANIIFGATLKPELEDELIITVIATGFDSAFFEQQAANMETPSSPNPALSTSSDSDVDQSTVESVNLDLDKEDSSVSLDDDTNGSTSIWNQPEEDEDDTPAFLRRRKKKKNTEE